MKKRIVALIALLVALSLLLVGCAQAEETSAEIPQEPMAEADEFQEMDDHFGDTEYFDTPVSLDEVAEPEELDVDPGYYLNLDGMPIIAMAPFDGGVGWIQYMRSGEMYTAAVETSGHVLFEIPGPVWYASPFYDGVAYVVVSDNATYYPNASTTLGCYEQVGPAEVHEEIYDLSGNLLYSTSPAYMLGIGENHIVCSGDGLFIVLRHDAGLEYDSWQLGAILENGSEVYSFVEYENIGKDILQSWRNKYSGTRSLPNMYGAGYGNGNDGDEGDGFSRYIGDGVYYITGGSSGVFYVPEMELVTKSVGDKLLSDCFNGKALVSWRGNYYVQSVYSDSFDDTTNAIELQYNLMYEDIGPGKIFRYDHFMPENLYYHDHAYYDIEMKRVIEIEQYTSLKMDGSIFNEGYALIFLVGADGNTYVTVIDEEGIVQFEPIRARKTSGKVSDGYFVVRTDTECAVYDVTGCYVRHLCSAAEGEYIRDISGGYVTMFGVVNGVGMNKIYDMNPEWER